MRGRRVADDQRLREAVANPIPGQMDVDECIDVAETNSDGSAPGPPSEDSVIAKLVARKLKEGT